MNVIHVPAPPKGAFHKFRPMSDLIKAQVNHFKHLEEKLTPEQRQGIPQHRITTENDAALYIASMTRLLRSSATMAPVKQETPTRTDPKSAAASSASKVAKSSTKKAPKSSRKEKK